ncbi:START-like domain [Phytophthora cinnamomi]|uniref:START-like domain n=1 Tax=Phytophthora cinnamomi TaxID=4785 RepID=UPI00355AA7F3|nr:START-like domain [Phytophthora cinnamomi]
MRFPLPVDTFPALKVSEDDEFEIGKLAEGYIHEALEEYMDFRIVNGGVLNKKRWKPIKTRKGVTAYRDLHMMDPESSRVASKAKVGSGAMTASTKLQGVLAVGTIDGEFNDMAFGLLNTNIEMLKIKSSYTNDKIADAKVLASIVEPTPTQPVRGTYIKWSVSTGVPLLLKKLVRPRDFVFLESIGIIKTESGERIGYSLLHSLQIPTIRELSEYQIVRANASICLLFRQKSPGKVELYVKGFVDAMGNISPCVALSATADALMSYRKVVYCGQMKKLNWLLKTTKTVILDRNSSACVVCTNLARRPKCCEVCLNTMCARCSVTKKLSFLSPTSRRISRRSLVFCVRCLLAAFKADALAIAGEELVRQNPFNFYEPSTATPSSRLASPSSTTPPDATSEFFG